MSASDVLNLRSSPEVVSALLAASQLLVRHCSSSWCSSRA